MDVFKVTLLLMSICFVTSKAEDEGASQVVVDFMNTLNGRFTNMKQVEHEIAQALTVRHAPASGTFRPVEIPAMGQVPVILLEEVFFGQLVRREVIVVRERQDGTIKLSPFNFTGHFKAGPGKFDVNSLKALSLDDFHTLGSCDGTFHPLYPGYYAGRWPNCKTSVNGTVGSVQQVHPEFIFDLSCNAMTIEASHDNAEENSPEPYILLLEGQKFPLPSFLKGNGETDVCA